MSGNRVELNFMVVPEKLQELAYVPDAIKIKITDADSIFITGILGDSGRKLVRAGIEFWFTKDLAWKLVNNGVAEFVEDDED